MNTTVSDNTEAARFEIHADGALAGFAEYRMRAGRIIFTHTETLEAFAGKGLASILVRGALDDVRSRGELVVVPLCPYVKAWIEKHPDYQDLLADDAK